MNLSMQPCQIPHIYNQTGKLQIDTDLCKQIYDYQDIFLD